MLVPPRPWTHFKRGGQLTLTSCIARCSKSQVRRGKPPVSICLQCAVKLVSATDITHAVYPCSLKVGMIAAAHNNQQLDQVYQALTVLGQLPW